MRVSVAWCGHPSRATCRDLVHGWDEVAAMRERARYDYKAQGGLTWLSLAQRVYDTTSERWRGELVRGEDAQCSPRVA